MAEVAGFGGLMIVHAEDPHVLGSIPAWSSRRYTDFVDSRPAEAEVKAEKGWDGTLRFDCVANLADAALAMEGMLEAAGFKVELNPNRTLGEQVQLVIVPWVSVRGHILTQAAVRCLCLPSTRQT